MFHFACSKVAKFAKYYDQDYLKIFFLHSTLPMMTQNSGKSTNLAKKVSSIKKLLIVQSFLISNFDLNQICEIVLTQSQQIWNFNTNFNFNFGEML